MNLFTPVDFVNTNHGYEPQGKPWTIIPPKGRGSIPSDFIGIIQLSILIHYVLKIEVSRIKSQIFHQSSLLPRNPYQE